MITLVCDDSREEQVEVPLKNLFCLFGGESVGEQAVDTCGDV